MFLRQVLTAIAAGAAVGFSGAAWGQTSQQAKGFDGGNPADLVKMSQPQPGQPVVKLTAQPLVVPAKAQVDMNYFRSPRSAVSGGAGAVASTNAGVTSATQAVNDDAVVNYGPVRVGGSVSVGLNVRPEPSVVIPAVPGYYARRGYYYRPSYVSYPASYYSYSTPCYSYSSPCYSYSSPCYSYPPPCYSYAAPAYSYSYYSPVVVRPFFGLDFGFGFRSGRGFGGFHHFR